MDNITDVKKIKEGFVGQRMIVLPPDVKKMVVKNPLIKDLYLTAIGYYPKASQHDRERKSGCSQYILLYCIDGEGYIEIDKKEYILKPNTYIIIPKSTPHHYYANKSDPWSIYWVHFGGDHANLLFSRYTRESELEVQSIPYYEHLIQSFDLIFSLLENNYSQRNLELTNILFLEFISSFIYSLELYPSCYSTDHINSSIEFMKENLDQSFGIQELADRLFYSVSHYSDLFRKKTGFSPMRYFNQLKIQKSCQYLYFTDMSIKEICVKVGIEDPYYFSRMFKKLMGLSPTSYRNTHKKQ